MTTHKIKPNIIHETYYSEKDYYKNIKTKKVCTVFDMINEKFPNYFKDSERVTYIKRKTIDRSDHVFCISETTKKDLIDFFNVDEKKITVTLLANTIKKNNNFVNKDLLFVNFLCGINIANKTPAIVA